MLRTTLLMLSAWLILGFAPATKPRAAAPPPEECRGDRGVDRCDPEQQRRVRELFGVKAIEAHRDAGDQVRRAFYVNGYGRELVTIVFIRPKGGDPQLWVHFPREADGKRFESLRAAVPHDAWEEILRRSAHFDRQIAPPRSERTLEYSDGEEKPIRVCVHGSIYTIEATDPATGRPGEIRRRTENGCDNGLTESYALELQRAAVPLLAPCARLDPRFHRGEADLLSSCRLLRGDRLAAAEVMNRLSPFSDVEAPKHAPLLYGLFAYPARIDWAGEKLNGPGGGAEFWAKKTTEGGRTLLYWELIEGETADRVRFVGTLVRSIEGENGYRRARVEQIWTRHGGDFQIEEATVGPFEPEPPSPSAPRPARPR